jgi:hypothetical protein
LSWSGPSSGSVLIWSPGALNPPTPPLVFSTPASFVRLYPSEMTTPP